MTAISSDSRSGCVAFFAMIAPFAVPPTQVHVVPYPDPGSIPCTYATSTGVPRVETTVHPVLEIRRLSGLTFEQLAEMFGVTRRTLHFWVSGQRMQPTNEERAQRLLAVIRSIDRGAPDVTREALLADGAKGFRLLQDGHYEAAVQHLGAGSPGNHRPSASPELLNERRPPPPALRIDDSQVGPHPALVDSRRKRSIKSTKLPRKR